MLKKLPLYTTKDVMAQLGISRSGLGVLVSRGLVPGPDTKQGRNNAWTPATFEQVVSRFSAHTPGTLWGRRRRRPGPRPRHRVPARRPAPDEATPDLLSHQVWTIGGVATIRWTGTAIIVTTRHGTIFTMEPEPEQE